MATILTKLPHPDGPLRPPAAYRAKDWWQYKLTPPLAIFWATILQAERPLLALWLPALALIAALAVCAAYVSVINDLFDGEEDARSSKPNRLARLSPGPIAALFAPVCGAALLFLWMWRGNAGVAAAYLGSFIAFTLYSAPPVRLKTRGLAGVLADATGSTLLPCVLALLLAADAGAGPIDPSWLLAVLVWALAWGVRGILWHQIKDVDADRLGAVPTFAQRHGARTAARLSRRVVLPLELAALAALLWQLGGTAPALALLLYIAVAAGRSLVWRSRPHRLLPLDEYYDGLLPLALLLQAAARDPGDLLLLAPLLVLFGARPGRVAWDAWYLAVTWWYRFRARLGAWRRRRHGPAAQAGFARLRSRPKASSAKAVVSASEPQ